MSTPPAPVFTLEMFGGLSIRGVDGPVTGRVTQRRRLALLAILAAERRPVSRDKLLGLLWPETESERARHLLADSIYVLRAGLSENAVQTTGDDVLLDDESVASDVGSFLGAIDEGDPERAVAAYGGPFLDGIFVADAPEFERWTEAMRARLAADHRGCLERLANDAGERNEHAKAVTWWRALAVADPVSSRAACGLMRALSQSGDRAAALQFARVHEEIVRQELDSPPDPAVAALVAELRAAPDQSRSASRAAPLVPSPVVAASATGAAAAPELHAAPEQPLLTIGARRRRAVAGATTASLALIALISVALLRARGHTGGSSVAGVTPLGTVAAGTAPPAANVEPSIAVLPFDPISSDREAEYIAQGVTDALIGALDRLHRMHVVSPTSAVAAKRSGLTATAIGDMLQSRYLLEGSVRLAGNRMHISAWLSDAKDGKVLWSQSFVRDFSPRHVIDVEEAIARSIAATLNIRLADASAGALAGHAPANAESFDAYLRGRYFWNSRNPDGVSKSIAQFLRSIEKDSSFAPAYAGLADAYATFAIGNIGDFRPGDYFLRSRDAASKALELDSTLAEAHASLGYFALLYNLDWATATRELSRAVDLSPSYSTARIYRTVLYEWTGRFRDAVGEAREARRNDPLSLATNIELGRALLFAREYDEAEKQLRSALELDPASLRAHLHLGQVLVQRKRFDEAIAELTRAAQLSTNSSRPIALLAHAYAAAGRRAEAVALLDSLKARERRGYVPAFDFAIVHEGLGQRSEAIDWLNRAVEDHSIRPYVMDPTFDGIRGDARFRALLTRLRLGG